MSRSSEKRLKKDVRAILGYIASDQIDIYDAYGDLVEVARRLKNALGASNRTDLERLRERLVYEHHRYQGKNRLEADRLWLLGRTDMIGFVLDYMRDEFGIGAEEK